MAKNETITGKIKETTNNVLHANENAKACKKKDLTIKLVGAGGVLSSIAVGFFVNFRRKRQYENYRKTEIDSLEDRINSLQEKLDLITNGVQTDVETDIETDDDVMIDASIMRHHCDDIDGGEIND